jgi:putative spermidine/putrescine transport system permease protein
MVRRIATYLYRHPKLALALLLGLPMLYMVVIYLGSLFALLLNSFYHLDDFSGKVIRSFTLKTYAQLFTASNLTIFSRTLAMAIAVTVADALIAFPLSYYMAKYASARLKSFMYLAVLVPLWSSYLVRVYAWRLILAKEGILTWFLSRLGLQSILDWVLGFQSIGGPSLGLSVLGMFITFTYIWLPYMILPIQTALERVPKTLEEASADLGAKPFESFRTVILPLAFPGVVAGSIFTFSLTLGDYIVPQVLGNSKVVIGTAVYSHQGTAGNIPLAAAFTMGPIIIMLVYLLIAKKLGAFDAL